MKIMGIALVILMLGDCKEKKLSNEIIIEGQVKNIPDGKIYLTEAHYWKIPLDSTICKNGHFIFRIKPDSSFFPYMASIHYPDSSKFTKQESLIFRNHMIGADSVKQFNDAFYLEKGYTRIEGDNKDKFHLRVFAGKQTDLMFSRKFIDFGWLGSTDSANRSRTIASYKQQVKKNPDSYFFLSGLYNAKYQYSESEIREMLSLFDSDLQNSKLGDNFKIYLPNRVDPGSLYPNLLLADSTNKRHTIIDSSARLTMLVFWASWCGPCRKEIPVLKEIAHAYKVKGLQMVSISIDENKDGWTRALNQEKMPWAQYIVDKDKIELVRQQFNFYSIPFIVLTDDKGKEMAKFTGNEKDSKSNYEAVIEKLLK